MELIKTPEELKAELKTVEGILSKPMMDYLNSLLNLEFSVIQDNISKDERNVLSGIYAYQSISKFNIYHRALEIFKDNDLLIVSSNSTNTPGICVKTKGNNERSLFEPLFEYYYNVNYHKDTPPCGKINIVKYVDGSERIKESVEILKEELNNTKLPSYTGLIVEGGEAAEITDNYYKKRKAMDLLQHRLSKGLSHKDNSDIRLSTKYYELLSEDYGLKDKKLLSTPSFTDDIPSTDEEYIEIPNTVAIYIKTNHI